MGGDRAESLHNYFYIIWLHLLCFHTLRVTAFSDLEQAGNCRKCGALSSMIYEDHNMLHNCNVKLLICVIFV